MYKQNLYIMVLQYMAVAISLVMIKMKNIIMKIWGNIYSTFYTTQLGYYILLPNLFIYKITSI